MGTDVLSLLLSNHRAQFYIFYYFVITTQSIIKGARVQIACDSLTNQPGGNTIKMCN